MATNTAMMSSDSHVPHSSSVKSLKSPKWDDRASHRFTTLRSTLQHSLILHSTHPSSSSPASNSKDVSLLSTRGPLRSGHYGRSQSDYAVLRHEQRVQVQGSGTSVERMMHSNHNHNSRKGSVGFPLFGRSISSPLTPPAQVVQHPRSFGRRSGGFDDVANNVAFSTKEGYSSNNNNNNNNNIAAEKLASSSVSEGCNNQFHAQAIRALLSDTPLPLAFIMMSSSNSATTTTPHYGDSKANNNRTILQPRQAKRNEHVYLLPRVYMRKWCDWVRNDIIISSVDHWLVSSLLSHHYCTDEANVDDDGEERVLLFELSDNSLQSLAALSIIADQYQLYSDDDNDGNEDEWTKWLEGVQTCWNDWLTCVNERGWLLLHNTNTSNNNNNINSSSDGDGGRHYDEKKEDMANHDEGMTQASQLFRDMLEISQPLFDGRMTQLRQSTKWNWRIVRCIDSDSNY